MTLSSMLTSNDEPSPVLIR